MHIISYKEPLLFVQGPPIFIKVIATDEESTSIFLLHEEETVEDVENDPVVKEDSSMRRRIAYLGQGFQREVYGPLQFVVGDELLKGRIAKIEGETVFIDLEGEEEKVIATELASIQEILWRGQPFTEG